MFQPVVTTDGPGGETLKLILLLRMVSQELLNAAGPVHSLSLQPFRFFDPYRFSAIKWLAVFLVVSQLQLYQSLILMAPHRGQVVADTEVI